MKVLFRSVVLSVAMVLMTGCSEEQRRREMQQEQQAFQQRERKRLEEPSRKLMEFQSGQDRVLQSLRESQRMRDDHNRRVNERLLQQQRLQEKYRPATP